VRGEERSLAEEPGRAPGKEQEPGLAEAGRLLAEEQAKALGTEPGEERSLAAEPGPEQDKEPEEAQRQAAAAGPGRYSRVSSFAAQLRQTRAQSKTGRQ
jgi:hypothetical protein